MTVSCLENIKPIYKLKRKGYLKHAKVVPTKKNLKMQRLEKIKVSQKKNSIVHNKRRQLLQRMTCIPPKGKAQKIHFRSIALKILSVQTNKLKHVGGIYILFI